MVVEENLEGELVDLLMERIDRMGNGGDEDEVFIFFWFCFLRKVEFIGCRVSLRLNLVACINCFF